MKQADSDLLAIKQSLHNFAFKRSAVAGEQLAGEIGELLLYLLRLAERLEIDPLVAAETQLERATG